MLHQCPHPGKPVVHHSAHTLTPDRPRPRRHALLHMLGEQAFELVDSAG
ncbi:hypothetical protein ACFY04_09635 [Streptomyces sp. NPDC001549]